MKRAASSARVFFIPKGLICTNLVKNGKIPAETIGAKTIFPFPASFLPGSAYLVPMKIADLDRAERPREKMRRLGVRNLTNAELVAVLLRTGTGGLNALEAAQELLRAAGWHLPALAAASIETLCVQKGVGINKAMTLQAAFELGRRAAGEPDLPDGRRLAAPEAVYRLMLPRLRLLDHEECWALYLNNAGRLLADERLSSGSQDATVIDPKAVTRRALEHRARSVILVHNHPSGSPLPGQADLRETHALKQALNTFRIDLKDHIIIAGDSYYSFADERLTQG